MDYIPLSELASLKNASDAKVIADGSKDVTDEMLVAYLINTAANTGEHMTVWMHPMSSKLKTTLEGKGYTVTSMSWAADPEVLWVIAGF